MTSRAEMNRSNGGSKSVILFFLLLASGLCTAASAATPLLRVTPTSCKRNDKITVSIDMSDPEARSILGDSRRMDFVITDAYRGTLIARTAVNMRSSATTIEGDITFEAKTGAYGIQGARRNTALTSRALFYVQGVEASGRWLLPNNTLLVGIRLERQNMSMSESIFQPASTGGLGFNTYWCDISLERTPIIDKLIGSALANHGGSTVFNLSDVTPNGFKRIYATEPVINARGKSLSVGCLVAPPNRESLLRWLKSFAERLNSEDNGQTKTNLIALTSAEPTNVPSDVCYCRYCQAAFRNRLAESFKNRADARQELGVAFDEIEAPRDPQASSILLGLRWTGFQQDIFPGLVSWLKPRISEQLPNVGLASLAMADRDDQTTNQFRRGTDLAELATESDALVTVKIDPLRIAPSVCLLTGAADVTPDKDMIPDRAVWAYIGNAENSDPDQARLSSTAGLEALFRGATGILHSVSVTDGLDRLQPFAESNRFIAEHSNLFVASRTVSDAGVVVSQSRTLASDVGGARGGVVIDSLASQHWSPRAIWPDRNYEISSSQVPVLFVPASDVMNERFAVILQHYVENGGRAYVEGLSRYDESGKPGRGRFNDFMKIDVEPIPQKFEEMELRDLWIFGQQRGTITARREGAITKTNGARVIAQWKDGSPAIVSRRIKSGEMIYTPSRILVTGNPKARGEVSSDIRRFYHAIASSCYRNYIEVQGDDAGEIRCAVLRTQNVLLYGLFNYGGAKSVDISLDAPLPYTYDLRQKREMASDSPESRFKRFTLHLEKGEWNVIANAANSETLEKEIMQKRLQFTVKGRAE